MENPYQSPADEASETPEDQSRTRSVFTELRWAIELVVMVGIIMLLATVVVVGCVAAASIGLRR